MPWIIIAAIATASSVTILALVNVYLYSRYKQRFMKLWALAWGVHVCRYLFLILSVLWPASLVFKQINHLFIIASAVMLLAGTRNFIGRPPAHAFAVTGATLALWSTGVLWAGLPAMYAIIPIFAFLAFTYIRIGMEVLKQVEPGETASRVVGWLFIAWGIHQADYPLLRPIEWFAPWGFLIGSVLATSIAIGMILIYFERTQRGLQEKEVRHLNLIESSHNWIWEVDADARYTFASPQVRELLGYAPSEVIGKTPFDLMPDEEAARIGAIFAGVSSRRESFHRLENVNRHKDGRLVVLETSGVPFFDAQGNFLGYRGMDQDITERKQAETRREVSREVLQVLNEPGDLKGAVDRVIDLLKAKLHFAAVGIRLQEGEDYPYWSEAGFPPGMLETERSLVDRLPDGALCRDQDGNVRLECTCGMVISGRVPQGHPNTTPGGSFWTNDSFQLLELPPGQDPRHNPRNVCMHRQFASIALVPIRYKDRIVGLIQCNDYHKDRFTPESLQHLEGIAAYVGAALMRKWSEEERVTLEHQLQQAQRMESIGRLAGGVAHDFNNMLGVIIGHAGLALMDTAPGEPIQVHLQEISKAAERSADLTRQLLAFARKQAIKPQVLDLNETIAGMLKMLQRLIGEEIHLCWQPGSRIWPVRMDPSQIDQIMANLCVNARDAIAHVGNITIKTGIVNVDDAYRAQRPEAVNGEYVWISVSDDGQGMDSETLGHIFEPFFTTKGVGAGTGLGLATIYGIVTQNKGFVNVVSQPGRGATFTIHIPRYAGALEPATPEEERDLPHGRETILLVEDEAGILRMTSLLLERLGYAVLTAGSPSEAIRRAADPDVSIDLLMTDVVMPEMNGRELASELIVGRPRLKCLFMSGYTADIIAHHGVIDEGLSFIHKPFSLPVLAAKLREVLEQA
ncbi:PAS domain S-box protein [Geomonas azotofigens]|uniref:PAS domain S-box protein n=1 Tax=Geomonas azotofigens TaxID=2843196 RepID=UPI001C10E89E|nr:PAS domain S-box protein [Geomonas azotofigens]MBU5614205.1 PAS domain S-box protein [Geomonas azotofigens]